MSTVWSDTALSYEDMVRRGFARLAPAVASLLGLLAIWTLLTASGTVAPILLPPPSEVWSEFVTFREPIARAALVTLTEVVIGFLLAVTGGILLAVALSYSRFLNALLYPPLILLHSIPKAAVAPLLLVWFGFGIEHKVALSFLVAFFPIVIALSSGLRRVDPDLHDLSRSLNASRLRTFRKIDLPFALPALFAGLRVAIHLAVVGAVIGEFVSGDDGLASMVKSAGAVSKTSLSFACVIILSAMSTGLFGVVAFLEGVVAPWSDRTG